MRKKRSLRISLEKAAPGADEFGEPTSRSFAENYFEVVRPAVADFTGAAVVVVGGYVAADTLRQVIVHAAKAKIK